MFEELVARQNGVVSLAQAAAHGYSADRVQRRVREGRWRRLHPGVVLVGGHRLSEEARVRAAWLWAGERAIIAGPAAARWHGMPARSAAVVDVTVPAALNRVARPGVRFRRRDLPGEDVTTVRGLRVTAGVLLRWKPPSYCPTARRSWTARCSDTFRSTRCTAPTVARSDGGIRPPFARC